MCCQCEGVSLTEPPACIQSIKTSSHWLTKTATICIHPQCSSQRDLSAPPVVIKTWISIPFPALWFVTCVTVCHHSYKFNMSPFKQHSNITRLELSFKRLKWKRHRKKPSQHNNSLWLPCCFVLCSNTNDCDTQGREGKTTPLSDSKALFSMFISMQSLSYIDSKQPEHRLAKGKKGGYITDYAKLSVSIS